MAQKANEETIRDLKVSEASIQSSIIHTREEAREQVQEMAREQARERVQEQTRAQARDEAQAKRHVPDEGQAKKVHKVEDGVALTLTLTLTRIGRSGTSRMK